MRRPCDGCGVTGRCPRLLPSLLLAAVLVVISGGTAAGAQSAPEPEQALAERFAPIIVIKQQEEPCDPEGEAFVPMPVEIVLDNPQVALRQLGPDNPVVMWGPSAADLHGLGEGFFLDFPGTPLNPGCIYERDFGRYSEPLAPTVYAHIVHQVDEPGVLFVQYWTYWYFNDWNNKHESDWEGVVLKFEASSIEEALAGEPVAIGYAQHEGGERSDWDDDKLERDGDRPLVYSSAGSHASYFDAAVYLGRGPTEGFGCDTTTGPSRRVVPEVVVLPDAVDDPSESLAWLGFEGRWGERQGGPFNGPTGPTAKPRWLEPGEWFEELRPSSVVIPAGGSDVAAIIEVFCGVVERGSGALITVTTQPMSLLIAAALAVVVTRFLVRRTVWNQVEDAPIVRRRRSGQIMRAAALTYRKTPIVAAIFGLVFIPAALVTGAIGAILSSLPIISTLLSLAGGVSGTRVVLAALAGSVANLAAFVVVCSAVALYLDRPERGVDAALAAIRSTWERRREVGATYLRAFVVVFVLLASIIGIPWAIRQLVRYQFMPQVVMCENRSGRDALARSSELVAGRWLHTAVVAAVINGAINLLALGLALMLLVGASSIPLWLFAGLIALVYALTVPLAAVAFTLLYGDAVAEYEQVARGEPEQASVA